MSIYIISGIAIVVIMAALVILWKVSRWILIPVQIVLFLTLVFIMVKIFTGFAVRSNDPIIRKINSQIMIFKYKIMRSGIK